jgi:hypothetical protein
LGEIHRTLPGLFDGLAKKRFMSHGC